MAREFQDLVGRKSQLSAETGSLSTSPSRAAVAGKILEIEQQQIDVGLELATSILKNL